MTTNVHFSSEKMDWQTPDNVLDLVRQVAPIGLDPCTVASNPVGAARFYTPADSGERQRWRCNTGEITYCNPPYGREIVKWIDAACASWSPTILLVPARTDTKWFRHLAVHANVILFWRGRIKFRSAPHPAPFPSALALTMSSGMKQVEKFIEVFGPHGWIHRGRIP